MKMTLWSLETWRVFVDLVSVMICAFLPFPKSFYSTKFPKNLKVGKPGVCFLRRQQAFTVNFQIPELQWSQEVSFFFFPCFFLSCSRASSIWLSSGDNSRLTYIVSPQLHSFLSLTTSPLTFPGHWFNSDWDTIGIHQLTICCSFLFSFCVTYFTTTQTQI